MDYELMREYLWSRCSPEPNSGCWLWTRGIFGDGYGHAYFNRKYLGAHRLAAIAWLGMSWDASGKVVVCHKCDNPLCINPQHLFIGTMEDNMEDAYAKGRAKHNPNANRHKTHCKWGHEFSLENTRYWAGKRICRRCSSKRATEWNRKHG